MAEMDAREQNFGTPYDDSFRTLTVDCPRLLIPMMNEIFGKHYTGSEEVILHPNEHFLIQQDGHEQKRITDSLFSIRGETEDRYLFECMAYYDNSLVIRVFEYAVQDGLDSSTLVGNRLRVAIPDAAVLYLRSTGGTPSELIVEIATRGGSVSFSVPSMKISDYSLDDIFERELFFLIPFYIFRHEKDLSACERDRAALETLRREYAELMERLDEAVESGRISAYYRRTVIDMARRVLDGIAMKYEQVRKGVSLIMGGQVLEHEGKRIFNEGKAVGEAEGIAKGKAEGAMIEREKISVNLFHKGISIETISQCVGVSVNLIRQWIQDPANSTARM